MFLLEMVTFLIFDWINQSMRITHTSGTEELSRFGLKNRNLNL